MSRQCETFSPDAGPSGAVRLARELRDLAETEDDEGRDALAWALVNRLANAPDRPDRDFALALSAVYRALAAAEPDPTQGATHFHPHTDVPDWAVNETPTALVGGHIFYAPPAKGLHF